MHIEGFVDDKFNEGDLERLLSVLSANSPEQPSSAPSHISHGGLQALSHFNGMKIVEKNTAFALIATKDEFIKKKMIIIFFQVAFMYLGQTNVAQVCYPANLTPICK